MNDGISYANLQIRFGPYREFLPRFFAWKKGAITYDQVIEKPQKPRRKNLKAKTRFAVLDRDQHRCVVCGATPEDDRLVVDHILPVSLGGSDEMDNLRTLCNECNVGRSNHYTY